MHKIIIFLLALFCVSCSLKKPSPTVNMNENGNILWASGSNEEFYMPESRNSIAFMSNNSAIVYEKSSTHGIDGCDYYYKANAMLKLCALGEVELFKAGKIINTGFANLHHSY